MDIELLSKMVAELIVDHDSVGLPGLGSFVAEMVPASFTDRGYTIMPPYRRLIFMSGRPDDTLLSDYYASSNNIDKEEARVLISDYITQMKAVLKERKVIIFPKLGRLRATKDNTFFFVSDENIDIFPEGIAMEPISLKNRAISDEELARTVHSLSEMIAQQPTQTESPIDKESIDTEYIGADNETLSNAEEGITTNEPPSANTDECRGTDTSTDTVEESANTVVANEEDTELSSGANSTEQSNNVEASESQGDTTKTDERSTEIYSKRRWWIVPLTIAIIAIVALVAFVVLSRVAPEFTDSLLYTPEELRIINY